MLSDAHMNHSNEISNLYYKGSTIIKRLKSFVAFVITGVVAFRF